MSKVNLLVCADDKSSSALLLCAWMCGVLCATRSENLLESGKVTTVSKKKVFLFVFFFYSWDGRAQASVSSLSSFGSSDLEWHGVWMRIAEEILQSLTHSEAPILTYAFWGRASDKDWFTSDALAQLLTFQTPSFTPQRCLCVCPYIAPLLLSILTHIPQC